MSQKAVERAVGKLVTDVEFRRDFFKAPDAASLRAGLELSAEELDALRRIPPTALARLGDVMDARICRLCFPEIADATGVSR